MRVTQALASYDEMLRVFKQSINRALAGAVPPPTSAMSDVSLTPALLDIVHAVRSSRPTDALVSRAYRAFALHTAC